MASASTLAQNPLPNNSFENWENINAGVSNYPEPIDWNTANTCSYILSITSVTQSNDAHSGSSSAKLETKSAGNLKINGVLTTANMVCNPANPGISGGLPYTLRPDSVVGWYKYAPQGNDTAYIQFILFDAAGDSVSYTKHKIISPASGWTRFAAKINYLNNNAIVSSSFLANSSWGNGNQGQAVTGSILLIDDVDLIFNPNGVADEKLASKVAVYPNPANDLLSVNNTTGDNLRLVMMDMTGRSVQTRTIAQGHQTIEVGQLAPGAYLYRIETISGSEVRVGKLLINL